MTAKILIAISLLLAQADAADPQADAPAVEKVNAQADGQATDAAGEMGDESEQVEEKGAADAGEKEQQPKAGGGIGGLLMPMILIFGLFYMMFILPDKKKRATLQQQLEELSTNDRVVTIGGILGKVARVNKDAEEVTLILDESNNTTMKIVRSAIRQILRDEDTGK